jgi:5-methylcytosine-specific restriction endonuclease McrA
LREKYNGGLWTAGRFNSFVTSILRSGSRRWGPKYTTLNEAKTEKRINPKSGRLAQFFRCASCGNEYTAKDIQVDHIVPIGYDKSWDEFIHGLFCERDNLQALCVTCHKKKTKEEKKNK